MINPYNAIIEELNTRLGELHQDFKVKPDPVYKDLRNCGMRGQQDSSVMICHV